VKAAHGFWYDLTRYYKYSGWRSNVQDPAVRNYYVAMIYHSLEKSLSYKNRNPGSGWKDALALFALLRIAKTTVSAGFHDKAAINVLQQFLTLESNINDLRTSSLLLELEELEFHAAEQHGAKQFMLSDFNKGKLKSPEDFFYSRYSLREFSDQLVDEEVIKRAITLAIKSPSACNRQAWHVYHTTNPIVRDKALRYQSGSRGFGDRIPNLLIIAADLRAFVPSQERYEHWIDGGIFSMSIIYALHSLGVASCCLNWSQNAFNDRRIRKLIAIKPHHTVIMMLAVGWPDEENKVCVSARRPFNEVYTLLE